LPISDKTIAHLQQQILSVLWIWHHCKL